MKKPPLKSTFLILIGLLSIGAIPYNDPTRPSTFHELVKGTISTSFELTGIFIYPNYKVAIVNGSPLKIGDVIDEYTITTIEANTVELEGKDGSKEHLSLVGSFKTKANK